MGLISTGRWSAGLAGYRAAHDGDLLGQLGRDQLRVQRVVLAVLGSQRTVAADQVVERVEPAVVA